MTRTVDEEDRPMPLDEAYRDIPGTTVFDADQARRGYWLNQFCMSLMSADQRERFRADERATLDEWAMTEEQKQAVLDRDYNRLITLGGNIYFLAKIGATDGWSFLRIAGSMTGMTEDAYREMMIAGGRPIEGNRHLREQPDGARGEASSDGGRGAAPPVASAGPSGPTGPGGASADMAESGDGKVRG